MNENNTPKIVIYSIIFIFLTYKILYTMPTLLTMLAAFDLKWIIPILVIGLGIYFVRKWNEFWGYKVFSIGLWIGGIVIIWAMIMER